MIARSSLFPIVLVAAATACSASAGDSQDDGGPAPPPPLADGGIHDAAAYDALGLDAGSADAPSGDDARASSDAPVPDAPADGAAPHVKSLGYYTGDNGSYAAIGQFHSYLDMVSADVYDVQTDGSIAGSDGNGAAAHDPALGIATYACVSNYSASLGDFDPALAHSAMVTNETTVIANMLAIVKTGYQGINLDFESLAYSANVADDRAAYTKFVTDLSSALHAKGYALVISVPAKTADSPSDTWSYPYDFAALGPLVDVLQLMTYDENGPGWSVPGPVAGADWTKTCDQYAASVVSPAKIVVGLPAYGYDWDLTASNPGGNKYVGTSMKWTEVAALLAKPGAQTHWDAASSSPYVDYTSADGHKHEAWYENPQSIQTKTALVKSLGLGGISMWALGDEDASFWQAAYAGLQ